MKDSQNLDSPQLNFKSSPNHLFADLERQIESHHFDIPSSGQLQSPEIVKPPKFESAPKQTLWFDD